MLDLHNLNRYLKRPRLLVQAARFGLDGYKRERDLLRLLHLTQVPKISEGLVMLTSCERELEAQRKDDAPFYSYARHIELLTAIMAETGLLAQTSKNRSTT